MDDTRDLVERALRSAQEARRVAAETERLRKTSREIRDWATRVHGRVAREIESLVSVYSRSNRLLGLLPPAEFESLVPMLEGVSFKAKQVLHRASSAIDFVYFPVSGLLSAMVQMRDGSAIEVAVIGKEGMAGLTACSGSGVSPYNVVVQISGEGFRIDARLFRTELKQHGVLYGVLSNYQRVSAFQTAYEVACNGLHNVDKRCCRRLLSTQDRTGFDVLPLTHDSLAMSLGVRRATVTEELGELQLRHIIECRRGHIKILDRPELQSLACECYQAVNDEYVRLFESVGSNGSSPRADGARPHS